VQAIWLCQLQLQPPYRYITQLGVILKREYPGLLQEKDKDGVLIRERPALDWPDYFLGSVNKEGMTNGERVLMGALL
jgi:hypothetical protein